MGKCSMGRKPKWTEKDLKKLQKKQSKNARKHSRTRRKVATVAGETVAPNARGVYAGRRKDVQDSRTDKRHPDGLYLRSRWEANYARYLMWLESRGEIQRWEYEPDTFWFEGIKRGVRSYLPDFKIWKTADSEPYYVEVKGNMDSKSATKIKRMAKYHPDISLELCDAHVYNTIRLTFGKMIPNWEV